MHKKFATLVSRICHSPGMPVCSEEEPMPEVDFNFCDPSVKLSEIKRVFFGMVSSDPFDDWFNPDTWNARLSFTSTDRNAIRAITCIADKPQPTSIKKQLSNDRRKITSKTHVINVTVDESTPTNHTFFQSLKKGKKLRVWYETMGGLMFGSNTGIIATVFADMILNRGVGEIQLYQMEIIWETLELEQYILSPIFEDTGGGGEGPPVETTMILYPSLEFVQNGAIAPMVSGFWNFSLKADVSSFVNFYALTVNFPIPTNPIRALTEEQFFGGAVSTTTPTVYEDQILKTLQYKIAYIATIHSMIVFGSAGSAVIRFGDIMGNVATCKPLILLHKNSNTVDDFMHPNCNVEQLYSTGTIATLRLIRTHVVPSSPHITTVNMIWDIPGALAVRPDPSDPTNINKLLVDLPVGVHTLAIMAIYHSVFWLADFPMSRIEFVIKAT